MLRKYAAPTIINSVNMEPVALKQAALADGMPMDVANEMVRIMTPFTIEKVDLLIGMLAKGQ
jgi:hypothetical protein